VSRLLAARIAVVVPLAASLAGSGCAEDPRSRHEYAIEVPAEWRSWTATESITVPGEVLEAWRFSAGAHEGSLVVLRSKYAPNTTAAQLLVERRNLLENLPGPSPSERLRIHEAQVVDLAGREAAVIDASGAGIGIALSPTGLGKAVPPSGAAEQFPTRRVWVLVPRGKELGTLEVLFHCPEAAYGELQPVWERVLGSLRG
jgi:hypothetical protein